MRVEWIQRNFRMGYIIWFSRMAINFPRVLLLTHSAIIYIKLKFTYNIFTLSFVYVTTEKTKDNDNKIKWAKEHRVRQRENERTDLCVTYKLRDTLGIV